MAPENKKHFSFNAPKKEDKNSIHIGTHNKETEITVSKKGFLSWRTEKILYETMKKSGVMIEPKNFGKFEVYEHDRTKNMYSHEEVSTKRAAKVIKLLESEQFKKYIPKNKEGAIDEKRWGKIKEKIIEKLFLTSDQLKLQTQWHPYNYSIQTQLTSTGINQLEDKSIPNGGLATGKGVVALTVPILSFFDKEVKERMKKYLTTLSNDVNDSMHLDFSNVSPEDKTFFNEQADAFLNWRKINMIGLGKPPYDTLSSFQLAMISKQKPNDIFAIDTKINTAMEGSLNADFDGDTLQLNTFIHNKIASMNTNLTPETMANIYFLNQAKETVWNPFYSRRYKTIDNLTEKGIEKEKEIEINFIYDIIDLHKEYTKIVEKNKFDVLRKNFDDEAQKMFHKDKMKQIFSNFNKNFRNAMINYDVKSAELYTDKNKIYRSYESDEERLGTQGWIRKVVNQEGSKEIHYNPDKNIKINTDITFFDKPYAPFFIDKDFFQSVATNPRKTALTKYKKAQLHYGASVKTLEKEGLLTPEQTAEIQKLYETKNIRMASQGEFYTGFQTEGEPDATIFQGFPTVSIEEYRNKLAKTKTKILSSFNEPILFSDEYTEEDAIIDVMARGLGTDNQTRVQDPPGHLMKMILAHNKWNEVTEGLRNWYEKKGNFIGVNKDDFFDEEIKLKEEISDFFLVDSLKQKKLIAQIKTLPDLNYWQNLKSDEVTHFLDWYGVKGFDGLKLVIPFSNFAKGVGVFMPKTAKYNFHNQKDIHKYNKNFLEATKKYATTLGENKDLSIIEFFEKNRLHKLLYLNTKSFVHSFPKRTSGTGKTKLKKTSVKKAYESSFLQQHWGIPYIDAVENVISKPESEWNSKDKIVQLANQATDVIIGQNVKKANPFNIDLTKQINIPLNLMDPNFYKKSATRENIDYLLKKIKENYSVNIDIAFHNEKLSKKGKESSRTDLEKQRITYSEAVSLYNKKFFDLNAKSGLLSKNKNNEYPENKQIHFMSTIAERIPTTFITESIEQYDEEENNLAQQTKNEYFYTFLETLHNANVISNHLNKEKMFRFDRNFIPGKTFLTNNIIKPEILTNYSLTYYPTMSPLIPTNIFGKQTAALSNKGGHLRLITGLEDFHRQKSLFPIDTTELFFPYLRDKDGTIKLDKKGEPVINRELTTVPYETGRISSRLKAAQETIENIITTHYLSGRETKEQVWEIVKNTNRLTGLYGNKNKTDIPPAKNFPSKQQLFENTFNEKIAATFPIHTANALKIKATNLHFMELMSNAGNLERKEYETEKGIFDKRKLGETGKNLLAKLGAFEKNAKNNRIEFVLKKREEVEPELIEFYDEVSSRLVELDVLTEGLDDAELEAVSHILTKK